MDEVFTVYIISSNSGRRVAEFEIEDEIQACNIAETLMKAPEWRSCNIVCTDYAGNRRFVKDHVNGAGPRAAKEAVAVPEAPYVGMSGETSGVYQIVQEEGEC